MSAPRIAVLGGGVIGLTTALTLELSGLSSRIVARERLDRLASRLAPAARPPRLASLHAAASVLPHSVDDPRTAALTAASLPLLAALCRPGGPVRRQLHYEVFETPPAAPPYLAALPDLESLDDPAVAAAAPRRRGAAALHGWRFRTFFCDGPRYLVLLAELYRRAGGRFEERALERAALPRVGADLLVDCLGAGSVELFGDPSPPRWLLGRWLRVTAPEAPATRQGGPVSYNYTPTPAVYPVGDPGSAGGTRAGDVYAYPRADGWILGGTREPVELPPGVAGREAIAPPLPGPTRRVDGLELPAAVLDLNMELVRGLTGLDLTGRAVEAGRGLRFTRAAGVRLGTGESGGRPVVHNTGHGGAGFTLSWGSAATAAVLAADLLGRPLRPHAPAGEETLAALATALQEALAAGPAAG
ncbi:MAG: FAD-dependent oxidoreductase [Thermoanaerobaculia bacterium]|nr:FAD-dependent oxidoreductase [Thermoanaerobaculia bacterium]